MKSALKCNGWGGIGIGCASGPVYTKGSSKGECWEWGGEG